MPWQASGFIRLVLVQIAISAVVLGAAYGAGGRADVSDQVVWLNIATLAAVFSAAANGLWLLSARRLVGERRRRLLVDDEADEPTHNAPASMAFAVPTLTLFHRRECTLIADKEVVAAGRDVHLEAHRHPCRWCEP